MQPPAGDEAAAAPATTGPNRLTNRQLAAGFAGLVAVSIAVAYITGLIAQPAHGAYPWDVAAGVATATGTILLAGTTGWLAYTTSSDVSATWESVRLTREDQAARELPVVVFDKVDRLPIFETHNPDGPWSFGVRVSLRNIGLGPALRVRISAELISPLPIVGDHRRFTSTVPLIEPGKVPEGDPDNLAFGWITPEPDRAKVEGAVNKWAVFHVTGTFEDRRQRGGHVVIDTTGYAGHDRRGSTALTG
jgi:hypothetical protein